MDVSKVAFRGFVMPIYALVDGVVAYTIDQVVTAFQNAYQSIPGSSGTVSSFQPIRLG